jgi:PPOX class probable F420-dependent enzyme
LQLWDNESVSKCVEAPSHLRQIRAKIVWVLLLTRNETGRSEPGSHIRKGNMNTLEALNGQQYLNLETFRKSGAGVKTPVWFVQDGSTLYVRTVANAGKVKRIRNNGQVNIAPCKMDGTLLGAWFPAQAREVKDDETGRKIDRLLDRKYGLMKKLFGLTAALRGSKYSVLEVKVAESL